jgi:hypothetical protein
MCQPVLDSPRPDFVSHGALGTLVRSQLRAFVQTPINSKVLHSVVDRMLTQSFLAAKIAASDSTLHPFQGHRILNALTNLKACLSMC